MPKLATPLLIGGIAFIVFGGSDLLQKDQESTRKAVMARIPLGTAISRARTIMEAEGFACRWYENQSFADDLPQGGQVSSPPADFLWCDQERILKRWQVIFVDTNGAVSRAAVGVSFAGP